MSDADWWREECEKYGFVWENVGVLRACSDAKYGRVLLVVTDTHRLQIRATPKGQIRVGLVERQPRKASR